jgi:hypothetical protein
MAFIKIDREIFSHWIWNEKPFSRAQAWIDLIGLANHETKDFMHKGVLVHGQRGNVYRSKLWLADRWGWSRGKVDRFLNILEKENMIQENRVRIGTVNGTVITIVNYGKFQDVRAVKKTVNGQSTGSERTVNGHIQEPIKNLQEPKRDNMPSADTSDEITEEELQRLYAELREEGYE